MILTSALSCQVSTLHGLPVSFSASSPNVQLVYGGSWLSSGIVLNSEPASGERGTAWKLEACRKSIEDLVRSYGRANRTWLQNAIIQGRDTYDRW